MKHFATIGLDFTKMSVHFVGLDATGQVLTSRHYSTDKLLETASKMAPCFIGTEACCGTHHLGRSLLAHGRYIMLMSPKYVRPFVKRDRSRVSRCISS